jgi:CheY-like chemotaxis protein
MGDRKKRVLVVDDEQGYLDMYVFFMEPLGIEVTCARNGAEAVEKVKDAAFDLIFMDVHMPVMTGPEAFRRIRQLRPEQKVVIFSSSSDPSYSQENQTLEEGALTCLYKPVVLEEIQKILSETIGFAD